MLMTLAFKCFFHFAYVCEENMCLHINMYRIHTFDFLKLIFRCVIVIH